MSPSGGATACNHDFSSSSIRVHERAPRPSRDEHLPPSPPVSPRPIHSDIDAQQASDEYADVTRRTSSIDRLINALRQLKIGHSPTSTHLGRAVIAITPTEFAELQERFDDSSTAADEDFARWCRDRVRYDYDPNAGLYTIRMPTAVHECFIASIVNALDRAIDNLIQRLDARKGTVDIATVNALRRVFKGASTTIELDASEFESDTDVDSVDEKSCSRRDSGIGMMSVRHSPDASYYHHDASAFPQLVIEVGYSQQRRQLSRLAETYIVNSRHAIRCVLGFDIPYLSKPESPKIKPCRSQCPIDRTATVSVWRPAVEADEYGEEVGVCACDMDNTIFRSSCNTACEGVLTLSLADLLPQSTLDTLPTSAARESICIPLADLASLLTAAERTQAAIATRSNRSSPTSSPTKFRKRKRSPFEALSDERELAYLRQEINELEKDKKVDRCWRSPSRKQKLWHPLEPRRSPRHATKIKSEVDAG